MIRPPLKRAGMNAGMGTSSSSWNPSILRTAWSRRASSAHASSRHSQSGSPLSSYCEKWAATPEDSGRKSRVKCSILSPGPPLPEDRIFASQRCILESGSFVRISDIDGRTMPGEGGMRSACACIDRAYRAGTAQFPRTAFCPWITQDAPRSHICGCAKCRNGATHCHGASGTLPAKQMPLPRCYLPFS